MKIFFLILIACAVILLVIFRKQILKKFGPVEYYKDVHADGNM